MAYMGREEFQSPIMMKNIQKHIKFKIILKFNLKRLIVYYKSIEIFKSLC